MTKLFKFLKPYTLWLIVLIGLTYVQVMTSLKLPDYMAKIVNQGIVAENNSLIWKTGEEMLLISLLGGVCMIIVSFLASKIAAGFSMKLRENLFAKVESFSLVEFNKFSTASLITRTTNDITQIQSVLIMILRMVLMAPIMGVGAIIKARQMAPSMTWIIALAVGVLVVLIGTLFTVALPKFKVLQKTVDKINLVMREILTGLRVIRAFNREKVEEKKFDQANTDLTNLNLFVNKLMVIMQPMLMLVMNFAALLTIWVGAHLIDKNTLAIGDMMAFMQYSMQVIMAFLFLTIIFIMVPRASVSADRVAEVLGTNPSIKDPENPVKLPAVGVGLVEFKDVYFTYPGADIPVLEGINFTAKPGEVTAFIGSTGSGKSTLINLIPRFYDTTSGQILIDGTDVREMKQEALWHKIGYVPQKGVLFSGSVESNIKYGKPEANLAEVEKAAKVSQSTEFIDTLSEKLDSAISQGGTNVSGGQKQRLSIARALIRKPEIYIFDDSFSALDFKTDAALRHALERETKDKTILIVAQRISTVLNADNIIVLDEGKIVGSGRHHELMEKCPVYREIALSQLSQGELDRSENPIELKNISKTPLNLAGKEAA
ncbi:MAG: ABC transporter ATP-binding protein [Candidatus Berkelbacteria bacterium]|nr:ABC transporter ATP-binding protein [Candidatus Berkelbacteria bacterium]